MSKHKGNHVRAAREHVFTLFRAAAERVVLEYHHFARTREIVDGCKEIAKGSKVDGDAREIAVLCAWFYDACYTTGSDDHAKSVELCLQFLEQQQAPHPSHEQIVACFRGLDAVDGIDDVERAAPGGPDGAPAEDVTASDILHDARLAVLASKDYVERVELLRYELQRRSGKTFSDVEWIQHCIAFFDAHPYRTPFAQVAYDSGRALNLARLQKLLRKQVRKSEHERADGESSIAKRVGRSAESLYYHFTRIQMGLLALADRRTSTMLHVNAIMLSIVVALLARRIQTERDLLLPTVFLLLVNLAVVFLSIHSMRTARKRFSAEAARARDQSLISFFNENPVSLSDYTQQMIELVADPLRFQRSVIEHLYLVREMLRERGRALRLTYAVFLYGITLAIAGFVVVFARR
jgi:hypothetical protein